jgi:hypothetical protein
MKKKEELRRAGSLSKAVLDFFLSGMEQYYGASFKHLSCKYYDLEDECPVRLQNSRFDIFFFHTENEGILTK